MPDQEITFSTYDGLVLYGTHVFPSKSPDAIMLLIHGILSDRDELGFYSGMADILCKNNIATLRIDYRCHGVDKTPIEYLSLGGIVNDIDAAFNKMISLVDQKTTHKYLMGTSFGGGLSAYWADRNAAALDRLFLSAPVISYEEDIIRSTGEWIPQLKQQGYIDYGGNFIGRPLINEMPYINGIEALTNPKIPVTIFHGDNDNDVPIESSKKYSAPNGECELFVIQGGGHGFGVPGDDDLTFPETKENHKKVYKRIVELILKDLESV